MIREKNIETVKEFAMTQMGLYPEGVMYAIVEKEEIIWEIASVNFDKDNFIESGTVHKVLIDDAVKTKQIQSGKEYDEAIGKKLNITAVPIINEEEECISIFLTIVPIIPPLLNAFHDIAPIIAELFSEGSMITITNTKEVLDVQRSELYDIPAVVPGFGITDTAVVTQAISTGKCAHADDDTLIYGPPIRVLAGPYFDHETKEVLGVVNILRPKQAELNLKNLSVNLERQLSEVLTAVQEIAAVSGTIHSNEQEVNKEIEEITELANQIVQISRLIKSIADSTKMLGLNASIEAARAGSAGRGFGVVAAEINKLSEQSVSTVPEIKKLTDTIIAKVEESKIKSLNSLASSQEQVASTEEVTATIEDIKAASVELANIANKI